MLVRPVNPAFPGVLVVSWCPGRPGCRGRCRLGRYGGRGVPLYWHKTYRVCTRIISQISTSWAL